MTNGYNISPYQYSPYTQSDYYSSPASGLSYGGGGYSIPSYQQPQQERTTGQKLLLPAAALAALAIPQVRGPVVKSLGKGLSTAGKMFTSPRETVRQGVRQFTGTGRVDELRLKQLEKHIKERTPKKPLFGRGDPVSVERAYSPQQLERLEGVRGKFDDETLDPDKYNKLMQALGARERQAAQSSIKAFESEVPALYDPSRQLGSFRDIFQREDQGQALFDYLQQRGWTAAGKGAWRYVPGQSAFIGGFGAKTMYDATRPPTPEEIEMAAMSGQPVPRRPERMLKALGQNIGYAVAPWHGGILRSLLTPMVTGETLGMVGGLGGRGIGFLSEGPNVPPQQPSYFYQ